VERRSLRDRRHGRGPQIGCMQYAVLRLSRVIISLPGANAVPAASRLLRAYGLTAFAF
jgi:hypothetical protein